MSYSYFILFLLTEAGNKKLSLVNVLLSGTKNKNKKIGEAEKFKC